MNHLKSFAGFKTYGWIVLMLSIIAAGCGGGKEKATGERTDAVQVMISLVETTDFERSIGVQGTLAAKEFAMVPARIGGTLKELLVEDGAEVTKGTELARIDSEQLGHAVELRRQDVLVARNALAVAQAQSDRILAEKERAGKDHRRFQALREEEVVSEQAAEQVDTAWRAAEAADKVARAQVALAEAQVSQAESALAIAERDLRDTVVRAPIDGVISRRFYEPGEMVGGGNPLFRIDNPEAVEFSAFLAESYFPMIVTGNTQVRLKLSDESVKELTVTYRAPTVHETLRTFEIKCLWSNPPDSVVPGMMAHAEVVIDHRRGLSVPSGALVQRAGKTLLYAYKDGRAHALEVKTGYVTNGKTEILEGLDSLYTQVISAGQNLVKDGARVTVVGEEASHVSF